MTKPAPLRSWPGSALILRGRKRWQMCHLAKDPSIYESAVTFGTLGASAIDTVLIECPEKERAKASINRLRDSVRNRDAHRYTKNTRASQFHAVGSVFIPALNSVLALLDQSTLSKRIYRHDETSSYWIPAA